VRHDRRVVRRRPHHASAGRHRGVPEPPRTGQGTGGAAAPTAAKAEAKKSAADLRAAQKDLGRLERKLDQLHAKEEKLHASLLEAATDPAKLMELNAELKGVRGEIEDVEARWLETSELLE